MWRTYIEEKDTKTAKESIKTNLLAFIPLYP